MEKNRKEMRKERKCTKEEFIRKKKKTKEVGEREEIYKGREDREKRR